MNTLVSQKKSVLILATILIISSPLFAEITDHSKWLPSFSTFDYKNIYVSANGGLATPLFSSENEKLTGIGFSGGAELGIDTNGWLFGFRYTFLRYENDNESITKDFNNNIVEFNIAKIFTKSQIRFFPEWLGVRVELSAGIDFTIANYYEDKELRSDNYLIAESDARFIYSAGIFADFENIPFATPFIGATFNFSHAKEFYFMPIFFVGLRSSIGKIKSN